MKKGVLFTLLGTIAIIASSQAGYAQAVPSPSVYAVKFVCGTQKPINALAPPSEPPVKPGNYATVINIQSFAGTDVGQSVPTTVSLANSPIAGFAGPTLTLKIFQTGDITCADITTALSTVPNNGFFTGYVDVLATGPVAVTSVYTSQGCTFPLTNIGIALIPAVCSGPTSIDVVPQQPIALPSTVIFPSPS